ncbi:MAG: hypothetical protein ACRDGV_13655 [Candidatus Limnocylindria bacterium]
MTDFERPGIDDPGGPGEPHASELDLPGPNDPVAWSYVESGTAVVGSNGTELGKVEAMLGTEEENIFHGVAVKPESGGPVRVIPADSVMHLTPSKVEVGYDADALARAEEHRPPEKA